MPDYAVSASYQQVLAPSGAFLNLTDAKTQLAVDWSDDDSYIQSLCNAACEWLDGPSGALGRACLTQIWMALGNDLTGTRGFDVLLPPVQAVTKVEYMLLGVYQTWTSSNWTTRTDEYRTTVKPAYGLSWPSMDSDTQAIRITFTTGYGASSASMPDPILHASRLLVSHWYSNRSAADDAMKPIPYGVERLIAPWRAPVF